MISVFKINDPYRLLPVFLILIILRLPFILNISQTTVPELEWLVLGEKLSSGARLYIDVYDPTGPLTAGIYWIFNVLFGRSLIPLHITALLLIMIQSSFLSFMLINHRAFHLNTYIPSLIFVILMSFYPDATILSPQLISMFFLLLSFNLIMRHIESREKSDWVVLYAGIFIGLAGLAYLPSSLFIVSTFFAFLLFTNTIPRRYFLLIYGFMVPFILIWIYFYWRDQSGMLFDNYFKSFFYKSADPFFSYGSLLMLIVGPFVFLIFSLYLILTRSNLISIQLILQNFMFIILITTFLVISLDYYYAPHNLILFFIPLSFFISQIFILLKKRWLVEVMFLIFLVATLFHAIIFYSGIFRQDKVDNSEKLYVSEDKNLSMIKGRKILYIGDRPDIYYNARLATPFLCWAISGKYFENLNDPDNLIKVTQNISDDLPEVIIDYEGKIKKLFEMSPVLASKFKEQKTKGIYYLEKN